MKGRLGQSQNFRSTPANQGSSSRSVSPTSSTSNRLPNSTMTPYNQTGINSPRTSGNPRAIQRGYAELDTRQQRIVSKLPDSLSRTVINNKDFNLNDLAAITASESVEFAMFRNGGRTLIIRGTPTQVPLSDKQLKQLADQGWRWSAHSHPDGVERSSEGDRAVLNFFRNPTSTIMLPDGSRRRFNSSGDMMTSDWTPSQNKVRR